MGYYLATTSAGRKRMSGDLSVAPKTHTPDPPVQERGSRSYSPALGRWISKAGIALAVTPHTFRRSCTTELLRGGANMYHVKELLGHESLETLKHYARLTITDLKATHAKCHPREKDVLY